MRVLAMEGRTGLATGAGRVRRHVGPYSKEVEDKWPPAHKAESVDKRSERLTGCGDKVADFSISPRQALRTHSLTLLGLWTVGVRGFGIGPFQPQGPGIIHTVSYRVVKFVRSCAFILPMRKECRVPCGKR